MIKLLDNKHSKYIFNTNSNLETLVRLVEYFIFTKSELLYVENTYISDKLINTLNLLAFANSFSINIIMNDGGVNLPKSKDNYTKLELPNSLVNYLKPLAVVSNGLNVNKDKKNYNYQASYIDDIKAWNEIIKIFNTINLAAKDLCYRDIYIISILSKTLFKQLNNLLKESDSNLYTTYILEIYKLQENVGDYLFDIGGNSKEAKSKILAINFSRYFYGCALGSLQKSKSKYILAKALPIQISVLYSSLEILKHILHNEEGHIKRELYFIQDCLHKELGRLYKKKKEKYSLNEYYIKKNLKLSSDFVEIYVRVLNILAVYYKNLTSQKTAYTLQSIEKFNYLNQTINKYKVDLDKIYNIYKSIERKVKDGPSILSKQDKIKVDFSLYNAKRISRSINSIIDNIGKKIDDDLVYKSEINKRKFPGDDTSPVYDRKLLKKKFKIKF